MSAPRQAPGAKDPRARGARRVGLGRSALPWAALVAILLDVPLTLLVAPPAADFRAPLTQRIFYYHVPAAWVAYLAFGVTALASVLVLWREDGARFDAWAVASAEVGTLFSVVALLTGLVWAQQEFVGYSALRDPKVISLVVVILAYFAYFALRANVEDADKRRRMAAVYGLLALVGVPLSYLASKASVHPDFLRPDESLDPSLGWFLLASTVAFTVLYAALFDARLRLARAQEALEGSS